MGADDDLFSTLELIAKHKIWSNEYTFAVVRGRNLVRRRRYRHEAIYEWQGGVGQKKCRPDH
jgi:hypothetical protein